MKKLFTLFLGLLAMSALFAQNLALHQPHTYHLASGSHKPTPGFRHVTSGSRATAICDSLQLDFNAYEALLASNTGLTFHGTLGGGSPIPANELTSFVDTFHSFNSTYIKAVFDTLAYVTNTQTLGFIPRASTTIKLDSLGMEIGLSGDSTKMHNDSLVFTIYKRVGTVETVVKTIALHGPSWFEPFYVAAGSLHYAQIPIGYQFNKGEGFSIRMEYLCKDTSSHFLYAYSYSDSCGTVAFQGQSFSSPAYTPNFGRISYQGEIRPSGATATVMASNNFFGYNLPGVAQSCTFVYEQVYDFFPIITSCTDYTAVVQATPTFGCSQATISLTSTVFGTTSTNLTYTWSATGGTLTSTSGDATSIVLGNSSNATIYLTVSDGSNTTYDTLVVLNKGINVSLPATTTLTCGQSVTLIPTLTGNQIGKSYLWNGGANTSTISANVSGTYNITVTNNSGCSATATTSIVYPGGVTNHVAFTPPSPLCQGRPLTFTNTTTQLSGWTPQWTFGDGTLGFTANGTNTYVNPGVYVVSLQEDSAGCIFKSSNVSITVLAASNASCNGSGIEDVTFANAINMIPNPTNGNVSIAVNGVEKNISIKVYNMIGSEVRTFNASDVASTFNKSFDFSDLANGTYLVKIQSADKTAVKRLSISK